MSFSALLPSAALAEGGFAVTVPADSGQGRTAFGGFSATLAYRAAVMPGGRGAAAAALRRGQLRRAGLRRRDRHCAPSVPVTQGGWWLLRSTGDYAEGGCSSQSMTIWNTVGEPIASGMQAVAQFG